MTHSLSFAGISIFSTEINKFCYIKNYRYRLHFGTQFLVLLTFLSFLINMVTILLILGKMTTLGLLKIKVFWNKGFDVIIFDIDVTNKILKREEKNSHGPK